MSIIIWMAPLTEKPQKMEERKGSLEMGLLAESSLGLKFQKTTQNPQHVLGHLCMRERFVLKDVNWKSDKELIIKSISY